VRCVRLLLLVVFAALGLATPPAAALDAGTAITQYVRDTWIAKDGAPAGTITAITQTPDGYLWLGTEGEGLIRFDGIAFVHEDGLDALFGRRVDRVTSVLCSRDGALWAGTQFGLARYRGKVWTAFDRGEAKDVFGLHEAADGSIWYARHWDGLYRVSGDTLTALPLGGKPRFVASDTRGVLWAGGYEGLWRLDGTKRRQIGPAEGLRNQNVSQVLGDRDGNVWVALQVGLEQLRGDAVVGHFSTRDGLSSDDVSTVYLDRDGVLWVGTVDGGLNRRRGTRFESLTRSGGLTNNRVTSIYEDRERSLWVGTAGGLNRLREGSVLPIGEAEGLSPREPLSVAEGRDGTVFVTSGFGGLNSIAGAVVRNVPPGSVPGSDFDGPLFLDPDGGVWTGHRDGIAYRRGALSVRHPVRGQVTCLLRDARSIVFATAEGRVHRLVDGLPERYRLADGSLLGPETFGFDYVWMLFVSRDGTLWLATTRGAIAVRDGHARRVWGEGRLSARSVSEDEEGAIWLGTMAGAIRVHRETQVAFTTKEGLAEDDVHNVLSDGQGGVWMGGARGIVRVDRRDLEDVAAGRASRVTARMFGAAEGMRTSVAMAHYQPSACLTRDGRLWFSTTEGVVVIDPSRVARNPLVPPVVIEKVAADDTLLSLGEAARVPAGTERLAIHYNGLSLLVPSRVRFRYKLEGYDAEWVDAGGRRVAYYTKLPPGSYRFRVIAANNDGVWNEVGALLAVRKLPRFHETPLFLALCGLALVGAAVGAHTYRMKRLVRAERALEARIEEALSQVKTLSGLLPICAWCKKVREDTGYWRQIETYVSERSQAEFTHGICPDCRTREMESLRARPS